MKKIIILIISLLTLELFSYAEDSYDKLANELANYASSVKKLAVIPFSYADNTASTKDGAIISERLTMKLINLQKFEIIERSVLNKVLDELKLQSSGVIDASSAKELGKVLGVDAIITGTLVPTADGKIEVNARVIKTETAQAIGASQVYIVKDWVGGDVSPVQHPQQGYQPKQQIVTTPAVKDANSYSFFEVIGGIGTQKLEATADENVSLPFPGLSGSWSKLTNVTASGVGPVGFRIGGFGKNILGGDFEFSVFKHKTPSQTISWSNGQVLTMPDGFFDITSFGLSGDLLLRTMTKVQLYFGLGLGMSINKISSTYLWNKYGKLLSEVDIGFIFRVPIGLRFNMDNTTFFLEWRAEGNSTSFDRGNYGVESHKISITSSRFCFGVGSKF